MEEKESSKERLIDKIRINTKSEEQILSKEFEENILCCCFDYDLTVSEFKAFNELKKKVIGSYDNQNSEHEKNLQELLNKTRELLNNDNSSEITQITTKENNDENKLELMEKDKNEYKKKIEIMESTIDKDIILINKKDEFIKELEIKHQNLKNSIINNNISLNQNIINNANELKEKIAELEETIQKKDEKINELNKIINSNKNDENKDKEKEKEKDISILKANLIQYKNEIDSNHSLIKLLKEQVKATEDENKSLKEKLESKNNADLHEMVEKTIKLQKELENYKNNVNPQSYNMELENQNEELKLKFENEKKKHLDEIIDLKSQIAQLKSNEGNPQNNININKKHNDKQQIKGSTDININEQYQGSLVKLIKAKEEIKELKKKIEQLEKEKEKEKEKNNIQKESLFHFKSIIDNSDYEEEIDMVQLNEGVKRKNRSEDLEIDFPGFNESKKKYKEMKEKFNALKEQVIPILKENGINNNKVVTKNNVSKICNLLGTSVNTTNNILQNYK